jgi:iron complex outermembrane receptor protein
VGPQWLYARAALDLQSEQFTNRTETLRLPARALLSAGATWELSKAPRMAVSLELTNLLDVDGADVDGYPLPPRAGFVTFSLSWDTVPGRKT